MKLIFCPKCQDVLKLQKFKRECMCRKSWGGYTDEVNAAIGGEAIPIGFGNNSFKDAIRMKPRDTRSVKFNAFVIPKKCESIKKEGR